YACFIKVFGYSISAAEPAKAGCGKDYRVVLALIELSQSGIHIAAHRFDCEVGPERQNLGVASEATGADSGALWQLVEGLDAGARYQRIADILTFANCAYVQARGEVGRQVLQAMDRKIDAIVEYGIFEFFSEQPLSLFAQFWKRDVLDTIAGCSNDFYFDQDAGMAGFELRFDPVGLPQGELTATTSDYQFMSQFVFPFSPAGSSSATR